jgi:hypothetical protein
MLIRKPVADVFEAIVTPEITTNFWFTKASGRLEIGKSVQWERETAVRRESQNSVSQPRRAGAPVGVHSPARRRSSGQTENGCAESA